MNGIDVNAMNIFLKEIKVVHEDITDVRDKEFTKAKELLADATRIYLLGFGFGSRNVERLGLREMAPGRTMAIAVGLT
jgi:DNA-binding MurR/RpiR family transcriptional regulator